MIISFDIDNTLIPYSNEFEVERRNFFSKLIGAETIRKDTIRLFKELENRGHRIWIYTTSYRSVFNLKKTFFSFGLRPEKFINETINLKKLKNHNCKASKNPRLFGIDIHIDDSRGVEREGKEFGFKTIIINPNDSKWMDKVLARIIQEESQFTVKKFRPND